MIKRLFDLTVASTGFIIFLPIFIVIPILIKLESQGPVFFRGERVGRYGKPFLIYKFRSMVLDADRKGASSTSLKDPRITRVGHFIRKFKLDEISQLINVFLGSMSLVGPRPQVKWAVDAYTDEEKSILQLRPGITDWASIKFHNEGEIIQKSGIADPDEAYMELIHPEKMRLQLKYLNERSFWIDLKILFNTVMVLFLSRIAKDNNPAPKLMCNSNQGE